MPIFVIASLLIMQGLVTLVNIAVGETASAAFGVGTWGAVMAWSIAFSLTFVSASFLAHWFRNKALDWYYTFAAYWFGLVHLLLLGAVAYLACARIMLAMHSYFPSAWLAAICFGIFFLLHLYGTWNAGRVEVTRIRVDLEHMPAAWNGRRVVFVSDIHLGNVRQAAFARKITERINRENPYAVLIGGDMYDGGACDEKAVIEPFRAVRATAGTYFITGNHEFYVPSTERALDAIRGIGMKILHNESIDLDGVALVGVDFQTTAKRAQFSEVMKAFSAGFPNPAILLKHEPSDIDIARDAGIALALFGHTHRGQIFPLSFLTKRIYKGFDYGLKSAGPMQSYTSSGAGTWGPPLRIGTRSEIVVIEFS